MSETEVRNTVTRPMSLQKKPTDIELPSTTTAVAVRKEIKQVILKLFLQRKFLKKRLK